MRILHTVEFYSPSVGGAQEVVRQVSEQLALRGHEVVVATTKLANRQSNAINGVHIEEFNIAGGAVRGFSGEVGRYREFLLDSDFDLMLNYAAQQWATDLVFPLLPNLKYAKVFVPCGFSGLFNPKYHAYFAAMPDVMRQYDHLVFHSQSTRDATFSIEHGLTHYSVIPNGAGRTEFDRYHPGFREKYEIAPDVPMLLTVGSHTHSKGHALVIESFRRADLGPAVLVVIGNNIGMFGCLTECRLRSLWTRIGSRGTKTVLLLDSDREDVLRAYNAADLFVFGSSVECSPLVLFESMASATPFLTLGCGNAAEIVEWSEGGQLIPTRQTAEGSVRANVVDVARSIEQLLGNPSRLKEMADRGKRSWAASFTWESIALRYEQVYTDVLQNRDSRHSLRKRN